MTTDDFVELSMMQLGDSFFPTGLYTMSNGLEILYLKKIISTPIQIEKLIQMYYSNQLGPADCVALSTAYDFAYKKNFFELYKTDEIIYKIKLVKETREAQVRSGRQLIKCLSQFSKDEFLLTYQNSIMDAKTPGTYPVSLAVSAQSLGIPKRQACLILLHGFAVSVTGAALRLGILDHFESQKILDGLKPSISKTIDENITKSSEEIWQFSPEAEIIQIHHELMNSKMFIT